MAASVLRYGEPAAGPVLSLASLPRWLRGAWGLLFSHPDDFASYGFESDRWLVHVQEAFRAASIRPLALTSRECGDPQGWVVDAGGRLVAIHDEDQRWAHDRHDFADALRASLRSCTDRFVMTLDSALRVRRTLMYTATDRLRSPIELAAIAASLRQSDAENRELESRRDVAARLAPTVARWRRMPPAMSS